MIGKGISHRKHISKTSICMEIDLVQILIRKRRWKLEFQSFSNFIIPKINNFKPLKYIKFSPNGRTQRMPLKYFDGNSKFNVKLRAETVAECRIMAVLWTTYNDLFIFDRTLWYSWKVNVFMEVSSSILNSRSNGLASLHPVPIQPPSLEDPSLYSPAISFVHLIASQTFRTLTEFSFLQEIQF